MGTLEVAPIEPEVPSIAPPSALLAYLGSTDTEDDFVQHRGPLLFLTSPPALRRGAQEARRGRRAERRVRSHSARIHSQHSRTRGRGSVRLTRTETITDGVHFRRPLRGLLARVWPPSQGSLALTLGYIPPSLRDCAVAIPSLVPTRKRAFAIARQDAWQLLSLEPRRGDGK